VDRRHRGRVSRQACQGDVGSRGRHIHGLITSALFALSLFGGSQKELHVYTSLDPLETEAYVRAFEEETGIAVRFVRMSSGELLVRVRAEHQRPQASLWLGGASAELTFAANEGLLEPYHPTTFDGHAEGRRDPQWRWMGISESLVGFVSNPSVLKEQGAVVPSSWSDLLRPEYHGLVSMAYAYTSGTAYTIVASLAQLFGEERAFEYWRALDKNVHHYNRSGSACVTQVGLGEIGTCIAFTNDILTKGVAKGYPVVMSFPKEGAAYEVDGMAAIQGGPEPELAHRFMDWILDRGGQALIAKMHRIPVRDDAGPGVGLPSEPIPRIAFSSAQAARDRGRIVELWREATGQ
jgi:iron(III) transport system substrate-binding protein